MRRLHKKAGTNSLERENYGIQIAQERNGYGIMASAVEKRIQERNRKYGIWGAHIFDFDEQLFQMCISASELYAQMGERVKAEFYFSAAEESALKLWEKGFKREVLILKKDGELEKLGGYPIYTSLLTYASPLTLSFSPFNEKMKNYKKSLCNLASEYNLTPEFTPSIRTDAFFFLNRFLRSRYKQGHVDIKPSDEDLGLATA